MSEVFLKILNMSISASWLVLAVLLLRLLFKKAPRWIFCALWALVALKLIVPVSFESYLSLVPKTEPIIAEEAAEYGEAAPVDVEQTAKDPTEKLNSIAHAAPLPSIKNADADSNESCEEASVTE